MSGPLDDLLKSLKGGRIDRAKKLVHDARGKAKEQTLEEKRAALAALAKRIDKPQPRVQRKALVLFLDEVICDCCGRQEIQHRFLTPFVECVRWTDFNPCRVFRRPSLLEDFKDLPRKTAVRKVIVPFCFHCFTETEIPDILISREPEVILDETWPEGFLSDRPTSRDFRTSRELQQQLEALNKPQDGK